MPLPMTLPMTLPMPRPMPLPTSLAPSPARPRALAPSGPALLGALAALLFAAAPVQAQDAAPAAAPRCAAPEFRQFDFWLGEWDVFRPDGQRAGTNRITREMGGCVLHESYDGQQGYHGESFNIWDASRGVWHQTWVDNGGTLLRLEGGFRDGSMRMSGETMGADGGTVTHRITWSRLAGEPARVRQLWESSSDGGVTWSVVFDGEYRAR